MSMKWIRGNATLLNVTEISDPVAWGDMIRTTLDSIKSNIQPTDTLEFSGNGAADFGKDQVFNFPACNYRALKTQEFITRVMIDATSFKPMGTPGFLLPTLSTFDKFQFTGDCWNTIEDGGLIGFPNATDGNVSFTNCVFYGKNNNDWMFYDWSLGNKKASFKGCTFWFARQGIAFNSSGGANYDVTVDSCKFYGNANGSHTYGASSASDPVTGGVLAGILIRSGKLVVTNTNFWMVGLSKAYKEDGYGCPRMACITDHFYSSSDINLRAELKNIRVYKMDAGVSSVVNDLDFRFGKYTLDNSELVKPAEAAKAKADLALIAARGGSGPDGNFRTWSAT